MIQLSNGHCFEYMAASGALAFNGKGWPWEWPLRKVGLLDPSLFTVVIKTLTYEPRRGNLRWYWPFGCIRFLPRFINCRGTLNSVGLTNPGIKWWCRKIGPTVNSQKIPLVGSILSDNIDELVLMAAMLNYFDLIALEFNASCPNVPEDLLGNTQFMIDGCRAVRKFSNFLWCMILKQSFLQLKISSRQFRLIAFPG